MFDKITKTFQQKHLGYFVESTHERRLQLKFWRVTAVRNYDYHWKQKTLTAFRKKAMDKNPDEFHFKMIHNQLKDGVHMIKPKEETMTEEQKKVTRTQDIRYVEMKRLSQMKVGMKFELHVLDVDEEKKNKHVFYVDSKKKEVEGFDLATHLNTVPELLGRKSIVGAVEPKRIKKLSKQRELQYLRLSQRIDREKNMFVISQKIQTRKDLQDKVKKVKVCEETKTAPAVYRFEAKRKSFIALK
uniref:U3 small nucleolar RNA-associated protein 11 n=1 Tax=Sinocyclocheilus rhinocerous TaxID=307959 RepID=A0A673HH59_9TELE